MSNNARGDVYIVDGARTPFLKARTKPGPFSGADLAVWAGRKLLTSLPLDPQDINEVILGCMLPSADEANIGRVVGLRLGCGKKVPGWTVQRNCASGLQALDNAYQNIRNGRSNLVLAGGTDAMSHAPILYSQAMAGWLGGWMSSKTAVAKIKQLVKFRPNFLIPVIALMKGLTDPIVGLNMGQTAENLAFLFNISRDEMDEFALESHQRLASAIDHGYMDEIVNIYDHHGNYYTEDDGMRRDSSMEKLAKLKPFFDKKFGSVTPGNSSQVTDGAACLLLASTDAVAQYNLPVLGRIIDVEWAALDPAQMGLGPVHAATPLLLRNKLKLADIDNWEINEAFSAQVLACLAAWKDKDYCKTQLGLSSSFGELDRSRLNVDGGAICIGHPIGASGARIVLHLLKALQRNKGKLGVASICIGGGQGGAMLVESV